MKTVKNTSSVEPLPPTLDELLSSVEHAGRDARRQKQLSAMIEQMAAEEAAARSHKVRVWAIRFAAAACLAGVIITAIRFLTPTELGSDQLVAEAIEVKDQTETNSLPATVRPTKTPIAYTAAKRKRTISPRHSTTDTQPVASSILPAAPQPEPLATENQAIEELIDPIIISQPIEPVSSDLLADATPDTTVTDTTSQPQNAPNYSIVQTTTEPSSEKRSLFCLRLAKPSMMEGNTLSFRII